MQPGLVWSWLKAGAGLSGWVLSALLLWGCSDAGSAGRDAFAPDLDGMVLTPGPDLGTGSPDSASPDTRRSYQLLSFHKTTLSNKFYGEAVALADINGDRALDIVSGKRFWAHGPGGDPEPNAPAVLYWFRLVRNGPGAGGVDFVPFRIDDDSGVGVQLAVADVSGDGLPDVVVANKKGTFAFIQRRTRVSAEQWRKAQPKPIN